MLPLDTAIIIIEDYKTMSRLVRILLEAMGFSDISQVDSVEEGLQKMQKRKYGLVISDLNLSEMDGFDLLKRMRHSHAYKSTPVIILSTDNTLETVKAVKEAGATNYIIKPFDMATFRHKISMALNS